MIAVETENLSVTLGGKPVLTNITSQVHQGEFVAVLGPNGAGKSVLLKVLLGLVQPTTGRARIWGHEPDEVPAEWIGYVPQAKTLDRNFPAIAMELVVTGLHRRWQGWFSATEKRAALEALAQLGSEHLAERPISTLSGGELQRVYLARSLVRQPRLVLLDEPVTGVDTVSESGFYGVLREYRDRSGATIIMVTHDWEVAAHNACHVLVLNRQLIAFGSPAEVLCTDCLKRAYGVAHIPQFSFCPRPASHEAISGLAGRAGGRADDD